MSCAAFVGGATNRRRLTDDVCVADLDFRLKFAEFFGCEMSREVGRSCVEQEIDAVKGPSGLGAFATVAAVDDETHPLMSEIYYALGEGGTRQLPGHQAVEFFVVLKCCSVNQVVRTLVSTITTDLESELVALVQDLPGSPGERLLVRTVQLSHSRDVTFLLNHGQLAGDLIAQTKRLLLHGRTNENIMLTMSQTFDVACHLDLFERESNLVAGRSLVMLQRDDVPHGLHEFLSSAGQARGVWSYQQ